MSPSRILIIDDSRTVLAVFGHMLRSCGHKVITASGGVQGVNAAVLTVPSLILCDITMPGLDGFEVVRHLSATARTREIPVVALTALTGAAELERIESAGFAGSISKTADPAEITQLLATFLQRKAFHAGTHDWSCDRSETVDACHASEANDMKRLGWAFADD